MLKFLMMVLMCQRGSVGFLGGDDGAGAGDGSGGDGSGGSDGGSGDAGIPDSEIEPADGIIYPDDLDKEYHGNASLLTHYDSDKKEFRTGSMMKSLIHATSNIGRDKMLVPHKDFTDDQWSEAYAKMGLPSEVKDYALENNVKEGLLADETAFEGFKTAAHKAGVLPKQAQAILNYYNESMATQQEASQGLAQQELTKQVTALKESWGEDFNRNLGVADASLKKFASEEEIKVMAEKGILADPTLTRIFAKIGDSISEDQFVEGIKTSFGRTKDEVQGEINSYYAKDHPFMNKTHPQNKYYSDKMMKMLEVLHGTK